MLIYGVHNLMWLQKKFSLLCISCILLCATTPVFVTQAVVYAEETPHGAVGTRGQIVSSSAVSQVECSGQILPLRRYFLRLSSGDRVGEVLVTEGAWVNKGTPLARLLNELLEEQVSHLMAEIIALQEALLRTETLRLKVQMLREELKEIEDRLKQELEYQKSFPNYPFEGVIHQVEEMKRRKEWDFQFASDELAAFNQLYSSRQELLERLKERINNMKEREKSLVVKAPFSGRIVLQSSSPETVRPGEVLLELWDESTLIVKAEVWQNQVHLVKPGALVEVFPDFSHDFSLIGIVRTVGRPTDSGSSSDRFPVFPVIIDLKKQSKKLVPGMTVNVRIGGTPKGK